MSSDSDDDSISVLLLWSLDVTLVSSKINHSRDVKRSASAWFGLGRVSLLCLSISWPGRFVALSLVN